MPELPDVETFKRYLESTALGKTVRHVEVLRASIVKGVPERRFRKALEGHRLTSASRHGKHLGARIGDDGWLVLHFGMTGYLDYHDEHGERPRHTRVALVFDDGHELNYVAQRAMGSVRLVEDFEEFVAEQGLGPDALALDGDAFREALRHKSGALKAALMDQRTIAGLGNVYTDEVLFQAGLHPQRPIATLTDDDWRRLHKAVCDVLKTAIGTQAEPKRMPHTFLTPLRGKQDAACPRCGGAVATAKVAGRTTYFCPRCQT